MLRRLVQSSASRWLIGTCALAVASVPAPCRADHLNLHTLLEDSKLYVTAPVRWDRKDWLYFGGALVAIGAAHEYDDSVRAHFTARSTHPLDGKDPDGLRDAAPAVAVVVATWAYATLINDPDGYSEAGSMLEAGAFSVASSTLFKYAAGRLRPNETTEVDAWRRRGDSLPSTHVSAAFAIGTVLAESGGDDYRWIRRTLGYGMAAATAYARLHGNTHWLSDTVTGAALGIATAHFVMNRRNATEENSAWNVAPVCDGAMLSYSVTFH